MERDVENVDKIEGSKSRFLQTNDQKLYCTAENSNATGSREKKWGKLSENKKLEGNGKGKDIFGGSRIKTGQRNTYRPDDLRGRSCR